jgi:exopolyphosphatase/guanosine-5'-triphosphate,3'-diphosphate pyrophosphatase
VPSKFKRLAAIDVGSNSLHLVIAKVSPDGKFSVLDKMKAPVRLGEGGGKFLHLSDDAISEGVKALKSFAKIAKENNVDAIRAVATSAVREAENKDVFVEKVFNESGINIEVVSGYEESRLIFLGASKSLELEKSKIGLCDIGGGSAELLSANNGELAFATSFKIGAIRMSEKYFPNEDVNQLQVEDCKEFIRNEIFLAAETIKNNGFKKFVGTSGTIQTLASMVLAMRGEKIPDNLNGVTIKRKEIDEITENIIQAKNFSKRAKLPGMDPKRADIIVAGAITFQTILYSLDVKEFVVSNYALREGILIDWIDKQISESPDEIAGYHLG